MHEGGSSRGRDGRDGGPPADLLSVNSVLGDLGNSLVLGNLPSTTLVAEDDLKIVTTLCNFVEFFCTVRSSAVQFEF